jgi:hypothetical protein
MWRRVRPGLLPPPLSLAIAYFVETYELGPPLAGIFAFRMQSLCSCRRIRPICGVGLHAEKSRSWWLDRALREMREGKKFFSVDLMQDAV